MAALQEISEAFLLDTASTPAAPEQIQQLAQQLQQSSTTKAVAVPAGTCSSSVPGVGAITGVPTLEKLFSAPARRAAGTTAITHRSNLGQTRDSLSPLTSQGALPDAPSPTAQPPRIQLRPRSQPQPSRSQPQPQPPPQPQPQRVSPLASRGMSCRHHVAVA